MGNRIKDIVHYEIRQGFTLNLQEGTSVILPVYNEEANIQEVISALVSYMRAHSEDFEIIAVDDGSRDATLERLGGIKESYPELRIITYKENTEKITYAGLFWSI